MKSQKKYSVLSSRHLSLVLLIGLVGCDSTLNGYPPEGQNDDQTTPDAAPGADVEYRARANVHGIFEWLPFEERNGLAIYQGDIMLGALDELTILPVDEIVPEEPVQSVGTRSGVRPWPAGVIPYVIDPAMPDTGRILGAVSQWNSQTVMTLVPRTTEATFVTFEALELGNGCYATVGFHGFDYTVVGIDPDCREAEVLHEIGHVVGMHHEQSRPDRDQHVRIVWENLQPGSERNFEIPVGSKAIGQYDLGSLMHYRADAFSVNGEDTIVALNGGTLPRENPLSLSPLDRQVVNDVYGALKPGECEVLETTTLPNGNAYATGRGAEAQCRLRCDEWAIAEGRPLNFEVHPDQNFLMSCTLL